MKRSLFILCTSIFIFFSFSQFGNRFENEILKFEEEDKIAPPPKGAVLFTGSSSIRLWTSLQEDFKGIDVINRGFGGANFSDVIYFMDRIVTPHEPKTIVIYAGSHDLRKEGGGPQEVLRMFRDFSTEVKKRLPGIRICYISMKPSLAKWETIDLDRESNELLEKYCNQIEGLEFIDIWTPMLSGDEKPREELFRQDRNHPSEVCYKLWAEVIRPYIE